MEDVFNDINDIISKIGKLPVFPSMMWVWTWDVIIDMFNNYQPGTDDERVILKPLEEIWSIFWNEIDKTAFTLEFGAETLTENVRNWLIDENILVDL